MKEILMKEEYDFIKGSDKDFILEFNQAMNGLGYENEGVKPYACWGKYVIAYSKAGLKSKKYVARFYLRDDGVIFRMYFTNIDKHRSYIENAPHFIKTSFTNIKGLCKHCINNCKDEAGNCSHRKTYTIDDILYEKCDGEVFWFENHDISRIPAYIDLLREFYIKRK